MVLQSKVVGNILQKPNFGSPTPVSTPLFPYSLQTHTHKKNQYIYKTIGEKPHPSVTKARQRRVHKTNGKRALNVPH